MIVFVVVTCVPNENTPCLPSVFSTAELADAYLDRMMRAEWASHTPEDEDDRPVPYPEADANNSAADIAQDVLADWLGPEWGRWSVETCIVDYPEPPDEPRG